MNPSPVLTLAGRVHAVIARHVDALPALPEERDPDTGRVTRPARPARDGYDTTDVTILTPEGGFCTAVLSEQALADLGGELPSAGDSVDYAVRPFVKWTKYGERSASSVGFSVAGDVTIARRQSTRRPVSAAS